MISPHFDPDIQVRQTFYRAVGRKEALLTDVDSGPCPLVQLIFSPQAGESAPSPSLWHLTKEENEQWNSWCNIRRSSVPVFLMPLDVFRR